MSLRFDNQTVVVTGVSHGLGRLYATSFASRGANVVVHDQLNKPLVDEIVNEITASGGRAVPDYSSPQNGGNIIQNAVKTFGTVHVIINNAAVSQNRTWNETRQEDWDSLLEADFKLSYKCVHAAWPYFKKQKFGRIVSTSSVLDNSGSVDSPLLAAARFGQLGFIQTLAKEGSKYNILAATLSSSVTGNDSERSSSPSQQSSLQALAALIHSNNKAESGHLYHVQGTRCRKLRWQRASGAYLNPDTGMTTGSILSKWADVNDYSQPTYPTSPADFTAILAKTSKLGHSSPGRNIRFDGKVVLVTGAGSGLGRQYALHFGSLGATVVVNDLKDPSSVAEEIRKAGGKAHTVVCSVSEGEKIVAETIRQCGRIDVVVNNAGFVRDKSIANMTDALWNSIMEVHLDGLYKITKAAWPHFVRQSYGRVVNIASTSGIYGNFGQSNYSLAKCAIVGFSQALAREGARDNIIVNAVAPVASTPALAVAVQGADAAILPEYSAPFVVLLCSDVVPYPATGGVFEIGAGWHARTRLEANRGTDCRDLDSSSQDKGLLADFQNSALSYPGEDDGALRALTTQAHQHGALTRIENAKQARTEGSTFEYTQRDVILYNLSLGAKWTEIPLIYERVKNLQVIPTFGAIPWFNAALPFSNDEVVPNWNPTKFLHGEIYLEICKYPIPTSAKLVTHPRLLQILDKKKAAVITTAYNTQDAKSGKDLFYNESSIYVRDAGGFGGPSEATEGVLATPVGKPPSRTPDFQREEKTSDEQAAIYRLNGDTNDLHVDPEVAHKAGFERPILHGLAFFGFSGKHIYQQYGPYRSVRVRFAGTVYPGQTLRTEAWRSASDNVVLFQTRVLETGKLCISGGRAELIQLPEQSKL